MYIDRINMPLKNQSMERKSMELFFPWNSISLSSNSTSWHWLWFWPSRDAHTLETIHSQFGQNTNLNLFFFPFFLHGCIVDEIKKINKNKSRSRLRVIAPAKPWSADESKTISWAVAAHDNLQYSISRHAAVESGVQRSPEGCVLKWTIIKNTWNL